MRAAVEGHVFKVVRQAALGFGFVKRARAHHEPQAGAAARLFVGQNNVAQSVGKTSPDRRRVRPEIARFLTECRWCSWDRARRKQREGQQN